jgi:exopolyphosphatase/guanosine-5'-triphosphate,3'-diphosphate pyrophosphatase
MNAATAVMRDYRRILDTYQVEQLRAVSTSAVREASNADAFLDRIFMAANIDVEIIEPTEESRLTVGAVLHALDERHRIFRHDSLIADVGGGSTLLTLLHKGEITQSASYRLGSVRLQESLATSGEAPERAADLLRHQIAAVLPTIQSTMDLKKVRSLIAVGGDARFAARRAGELTETPHLYRVPTRVFDTLVKRCAKHSADDLARRYDLPYADAETLVAALLVCQSLLHATKAQELYVSEVSMRDGLLLDLVRSVRGEEDSTLATSIIHSAMSIGEKYHYDEKHARHVTELALQIFDAMQREHGLSARDRLLLRVAGILHEVGGYISARAHHKHSYYLISNSEVFGLRRTELQIAAHVARYHRRSCPKPTHIEYVALPRESRVIVSKLAAILRVADALDRGHARQIRDVSFERRGDELIIHVRGAADLTLERMALASKSDLFQDIYGMRVRLEEAGISTLEQGVHPIE